MPRAFLRAAGWHVRINRGIWRAGSEQAMHMEFGIYAFHCSQAMALTQKSFKREGCRSVVRTGIWEKSSSSFEDLNYDEPLLSFAKM